MIDVRKEVEQDLAAMPPTERQLLSGRVLAFLAVSISLLCGVFFSDQLGLTQWMEKIGHVDVQRYYEHR